jgi:carbamoyl-phosphate synthase large subunit
MLNVLVTSIETATGRGLLKGLKASRMRTRVVGMASVTTAPALYQLESAYVNRADDESNYVDAAAEIVRRESVGAILPGSEADRVLFQSHRDRLLDGTEAVLATGHGKLAGLGDDRLTAYAFFRGEGIDYPRTVPGDDSAAVEALLDDVGWPLVVKPRWGYATERPMPVQTRQELELTVRTMGEAIVQEYVSDDEGDFVASVFGDDEARPAASIVLRRVVGGVTGTRYELSHDVALREAVETIAGRLDATGPMMLHFRPRGGRPCLLAANPGFSESAAASLAMGYNEADLALKRFVRGRKIERPELHDAVVLEATQEVVLEGMTFEAMESGTAVGRCAVRTLPVE